MANKYSLKTWAAQGLAAAAASHIGGVVPKGKTRFLTFIRVSNRSNILSGVTGAACKVGECTASVPTAASILAGMKLPVKFVSLSKTSGPGIAATDKVQSIPDRPDIQNPILSVAGEKYMAIGVSAASAGVDVFAQYYDE